jgi:hypothetical protein
MSLQEELPQSRPPAWDRRLRHDGHGETAKGPITPAPLPGAAAKQPLGASSRAETSCDWPPAAVHAWSGRGAESRSCYGDGPRIVVILA